MSVQALELNALKHATTVALLLGALLLALEPALWLLGTWHEQGYDGIGWVAFALVCALFAWSLSSRLRTVAEAQPDSSGTLALLAGTAAIRLAAQVLDVNVLGALLLAVDVYACARLAGLDRRQRTLSPFWLAVLFCFSLPIEPMLQRVFGYLLQQISALLACGMLLPFFRGLTCSGVRLQVDAADVLVDLPCSGAELVSITGLVFALINTLRRPALPGAFLACAVWLLAALVVNGLRIALLAAGIAHADKLSFSVMAPLPHTLIGLSMVALASLALLSVSRRLPVAAVAQPRTRQAPDLGSAKASRHASRARPVWVRFLCSVSFLTFALLVGAIQPRPVDASPLVSSPSIPRSAAGFFAEENALSAEEQRYFTRYGGNAARASFGPFGLLLVSTASPLRHLHDPTICLTGMGYAVRLLGTDHNTATTVYLAEKDPGDAAAAERFTVRVSYRSSDDQTASSIAEVVWRWLHDPSTRWTMVQRVTPEHPSIHAETAARWESAMRRAFNLT